MGLLVFWLKNRFYLQRGKTEFPMRPDQAVWGRAVYYSAGKYHAACPDWIKILGEANPNCLDEEGRDRVFGKSSPPPQA